MLRPQLRQIKSESLGVDQSAVAFKALLVMQMCNHGLKPLSWVGWGWSLALKDSAGRFGGICGRSMIIATVICDWGRGWC